jgi:AcrR family transcriptional regulator
VSASTRSGPSTADVILDAAEELFAGRGYASTSIKDIGRAAKTNPALLYYYFKDKAGLYRAVLRRIGDALIRQGRQAIRESTDPEALIRGIVMAQSTFVRERPRAAAIIIREMIDHEAVHCEPMLHEISADLFQPLVRAIELGQQQGVFRADLDPRYAAISIVAQNVYFTLARPAVRLLLGKPSDFPRPADVKRFGEHAADFAASALLR